MAILRPMRLYGSLCNLRASMPLVLRVFSKANTGTLRQVTLKPQIIQLIFFTILICHWWLVVGGWLLVVEY